LSLINLQLIAFKIALLFCAISTVGYLSSLLVKKVRLAKISTWVLAAALCFLTVNLIFAFINLSALINPGSRDFLSLCAWSVCAVYLALQFKTKTRVLGAFISPFILLFMIAAAGEATDKSLLPLNLQNWLTAVHLFSVIMGEALFIIASCAGLMFIMQNRMLKYKSYLPFVGISYFKHRDYCRSGFRAIELASRLADRSESNLDFCRLDYLRISSASAFGHRLEGLPDGRNFRRRFYSTFAVLWRRKVVFFNVA